MNNMSLIEEKEELKQDQDLLLDVENLSVEFLLEEGSLKALDNVSFSIRRGQTLGLVGESGCGKSVTSQAIMRIVPAPGVVKGRITLFSEDGNSQELVSLPANGELIRSIRGKNISMIFQEPMTSFSPLYTMGNQLMEMILLHKTSDKTEARNIAIEMMKRVGIANPENRIDEYPHQFSGGMRQRIMIAMALSCNPQLLIADEPTTALDVTIQAQVLEVMKKMQKEFGSAILFITHDLGVVAEMCDEVAVMYLGKIVEKAPVDEIFHNPLHPYTRGLLKAIPSIYSDGKEELFNINGTVPIPIDLPDQCGFYDRCMEKHNNCGQTPPELIEVQPGHWIRCIHHDTPGEDLNNG